MIKNRITLIVFAILLVYFAGSCAPAQDVPKFAEDALAATVYLEMTNVQGLPISYGSGFFVSQGHIVTNYHVIAGTASGTAKIVGKPITYPIQGIIGIDVDNDLVLLQVTTPKVKTLRLGDSDTVQIGEEVFVTGNPMGLQGTFSRGSISGIRSTKDGKSRIQIDAAISQGSSGGPVLNSKGLVIGVAFMTIDGGQNLNFAIPSKYIKALLNTKGYVTPLAHGKNNISAETYFYRGNTKYDIGFYQNAISDYSKAIRLKSNFAMAYNNRGLAKAALGQHFEAIADYDIAIRLEPNDAMSYYNRGLEKAALGQHFEAIADYDIAIRLEPDDADAYYLRGRAKAKLGQYSEALADFDTAIRLKPDDADAYYLRGRAKAELGQYFEAIADFDTAIRLKPDDAIVYYLRGSVKASLNQYSEAIADFDTAIRLKPNFVEPYNNRGRAKAELGQYFEAIADYDTAIRLNPDFAAAYRFRGSAKASLNQYFEAIADYDTAIRLNPGDAPTYLIRGFAKTELGQTWAAKQDLHTALRLATQAGDVELKNYILRLLE